MKIDKALAHLNPEPGPEFIDPIVGWRSYDSSYTVKLPPKISEDTALAHLNSKPEKKFRFRFVDSDSDVSNDVDKAFQFLRAVPPAEDELEKAVCNGAMELEEFSVIAKPIPPTESNELTKLDEPEPQAVAIEPVPDATGNPFDFDQDVQELTDGAV